jgi:methionine-gamma-lyase
MIAISLRGGYAAARSLTSSVELFTHAVSLGGVDSLIQHPAALTHRPVAPDARPSADIVRLSIGLEDTDDLIADLDRALGGLNSNLTTRDVPEPLLLGGRTGFHRDPPRPSLGESPFHVAAAR